MKVPIGTFGTTKAAVIPRLFLLLGPADIASLFAAVRARKRLFSRATVATPVAGFHPFRCAKGGFPAFGGLRLHTLGARIGGGFWCRWTDSGVDRTAAVGTLSGEFGQGGLCPYFFQASLIETLANAGVDSQNTMRWAGCATTSMGITCPLMNSPDSITVILTQPVSGPNGAS